MLFQCWASVEDGGPTLKQHWTNAPCLLGKHQPTDAGSTLKQQWVNILYLFMPVHHAESCVGSTF